MSTSPLLQKISSLITPWSLSSVPDFPYQEWTDQQVLYEDRINWYKGIPLNEKIIDPVSKTSVDKYPIKINPLKNTCRKHAAVLFGLTIDSIRHSTIPFKFVPKIKDKAQRAAAQKLLDTIVDILEESNAGTMFIENGIKSQYMGGCVFAVRWVSSTSTLKISNPSANEFIGIPNNGDPFDLKEAWIVREITYTTAKSYDPEISNTENYYYYIEHWNLDKFEIHVNGKKIDGGKNVFGIVPIVYIPHIRVDEFIGTSVVNEFTKGVIKEMNLRWADLGDAISDDSHDVLIGLNIPGNVKVEKLGDGRRWYNLGSNNGLDKENKPDMKVLESSSASETMMNFGNRLESMYRREVDHPAVADGEDEGSQRSSLTLNTRMWPLISHVDLERQSWTVGLLTLLKIMIKMLSVKKVKDFSEKSLDYKFNVAWPPMLPKDREALITELSTRKDGNLGSLKHLLTLMDDIEYPDEELAEIMKELAQFAEIQAKANPPTAPGSDKKKTQSLESRSQKSSESRLEN